eukprot:1893012-Prymnesium_polylepis.2
MACYGWQVLTPRHFDKLTEMADSLCIDFVRKYDALHSPSAEDRYDPDHVQLAAQVREPGGGPTRRHAHGHAH